MKVSKHYRLSPDTLRMIDEIVEFFIAISPIGRVTATDVVEGAIQRLYAETIGNEEKKDS